MPEAEATSASVAVALVTGGSGAIGSAIVGRLARWCAYVASVDLTPPAVRHAGAVTHWPVDLADQGSIEAMVDGVVAAHGRIDVLVNVAGLYGDFHRVDRIDPDVWRRYLDVNATGPFLLARKVLPVMAAQGSGRIVSVASVSATNGGYRQAHYAASKAALIALTNTIALEYGAAGITANSVLPGPIETGRLADSPVDVLAGALADIPANRFGLPDEVAAVVELLCRPEAGYVNGASVPVDGGTSLLQLKFSRRVTPAAIQVGEST